MIGLSIHATAFHLTALFRIIYTTSYRSLSKEVTIPLLQGMMPSVVDNVIDPSALFHRLGAREAAIGFNSLVIQAIREKQWDGIEYHALLLVLRPE